MEKRYRPDKVEYEYRLNAIQEWMADGLTTKAIIGLIMENLWATSTRAAHKYYCNAQKRRQAIEKAPIAQHHIWLQELKRQVRHMGVAYEGTPGGMRAILALVKEINKMQKLYTVADPPPEPVIYDRVPMIIIENPNITPAERAANRAMQSPLPSAGAGKS